MPLYSGTSFNLVKFFTQFNVTANNSKMKLYNFVKDK